MNDTPYRAIMCAVIEQAYHDATSNNITIQDRESAKAYLHGALFEFDAQLLGIDKYVERIRRMIDNTYQPELVRT